MDPTCVHDHGTLTHQASIQDGNHGSAAILAMHDQILLIFIGLQLSRDVRQPLNVSERLRHTYVSQSFDYLQYRPCQHGL